MRVTSWGRVKHQETKIIYPNVNIAEDISNYPKTFLVYGNGRSYGDICLNPDGNLLSLNKFKNFIHFDRVNGILECQSGILLKEIQDMASMDGWILPVTPGTQLITVGGAIANDIHGKNHHKAGSFGDHVLQFTLARTDGSLMQYRPADAMFAATVGGLGLTGVITEVELQLQRVPGPWLAVETLAYRNLTEFFELADSSEADWEHTVSWVDCLSGEGRGIFMRANSVDAGKDQPRSGRSIKVPFVPPVSLVNRWSLRPFNALYFHQKKSQRASVQHYETFFHPLDNVLEWNRIYGPRGFFQYQCVLPRAVGKEATQAILRRIARSGTGSFLAVLKTFGERESKGLLSFAMPGVTLALDFPNQGAPTLQLLSALDAIVREAKGRLYPAKDARMPVDLFESGYPHLKEFLIHRDSGISSAMSRRLMGN